MNQNSEYQEEHMYSNGNSFSNGNSMDPGGAQTYGIAVPDGSRPASAAWMFTVLIWRI